MIKKKTLLSKQLGEDLWFVNIIAKRSEISATMRLGREYFQKILPQFRSNWSVNRLQ